MSRRLEVDELRAVCDTASLPFRSTAELQPLRGLTGQQRALDATYDAVQRALLRNVERLKAARGALAFPRPSEVDGEAASKA